MMKAIFSKAPFRSSPAGIVRSIKEDLMILENGDSVKQLEKAKADLSKQLVTLKNMLFKVQSGEMNRYVFKELSQEVYDSNLLVLLVRNLHRIAFEGKKDTVHIFNNVLRKQIGTTVPTVDYIAKNPEILSILCKGYEHQESALSCGLMLRLAIHYEVLAKILLNSDYFYDFFDYVQVSMFDIASDAFATLKDLLTKHKGVAAAFLEANYETLFSKLRKLLHSENYATRRQAIGLLAEIILSKHNPHVRLRYTSNSANLKLMMKMMKESSKSIQLEAFNVFKVFVASPDKPKPILDILLRNQDRLISFFSDFHTERQEHDDRFFEDKMYIVDTIKNLREFINVTNHPEVQNNFASSQLPELTDHPMA